MNQHTIDIINDEINKGNKFFYFNRRTMKLESSRPDNKGSFYDLDVSDCFEIYLDHHTTIKYVCSILEFYNGII